MSARKVPNPWEDDDWEQQLAKDTPTAVYGILRSNAVVDLTPAQQQYVPAAPQPKTFYKPELKILKRTPSPSPSSPPSSSKKVAAPNVQPDKQETEKERREREHKEKERRYKETRDKIFASPAALVAKPARRSVPSPSPPRTSSARSSPSPANKNRTNTNGGRKPEVGNSGAITSLSLNGGEFTSAPPLPAKKAWEVDEKMLESQLAGMGGFKAEERQEEGLDWDSFERGRSPQVVADWGSLERGNLRASDNHNNSPTPTPTPPPIASTSNKRPGVIRAPRGPDMSGGKGFKGRGKAREVKEFIPGNAWAMD